jgi:hypothetical protein
MPMIPPVAIRRIEPRSSLVRRRSRPGTMPWGRSCRRASRAVNPRSARPENAPPMQDGRRNLKRPPREGYIRERSQVRNPPRPCDIRPTARTAETSGVFVGPNTRTWRRASASLEYTVDLLRCGSRRAVTTFMRGSIHARGACSDVPDEPATTPAPAQRPHVQAVIRLESDVQAAAGRAAEAGEEDRVISRWAPRAVVAGGLAANPAAESAVRAPHRFAAPRHSAGYWIALSTAVVATEFVALLPMVVADGEHRDRGRRCRWGR